MTNRGASGQAVLTEPAAAAGQPRWAVRRPWQGLVLAVLTAGLWQLAFAPVDAWPVAYVMLVPWAMAVATARRMRGALLFSALAGVLTFGLGLYWLTWITPGGYLGIMVVVAVYWLVSAWALRRSLAAGVPAWLALPVVWVGLEYFRSVGPLGFPWFLLGHSQHSLPRLIQLADVTGVYGVSLVVGLANGLVLDALLAWPARPRRVKVGSAVLAAALAGLLVYGSWRLSQDTTSPGPTVGVVQGAFPVALGVQGADDQEVLDTHIDQSRRLMDAELDLLVWPETVLPWSVDEDWGRYDLDRLTPAGQRLVQGQVRMQRQLAELLAEMDVPLIGGGMTRRDLPGPEDELFNTALQLRARPGPDGPSLEVVARYAKMQPVPFSEYVPFGRSVPWLHGFIRQFVPPSMPQLTPGAGPVVFGLVDGRGQSWRLATPICYEGVFGSVCRKLATRQGRKAIDVLVNISNDGWFIWQRPGGDHASLELDQHLAVYKFRAIENRVPVVRAVNTGISGFVDSNGRLVARLTDEAGRSKMATGVAVHQVLVDRRRPLYAVVGDLAGALCLAGLGGLLLVPTLKRLARRRARTP